MRLSDIEYTSILKKLSPSVNVFVNILSPTVAVPFGYTKVDHELIYFLG